MFIAGWLNMLKSSFIKVVGDISGERGYWPRGSDLT